MLSLNCIGVGAAERPLSGLVFNINTVKLYPSLRAIYNWYHQKVREQQCISMTFFASQEFLIYYTLQYQYLFVSSFSSASQRLLLLLHYMLSNALQPNPPHVMASWSILLFLFETQFSSVHSQITGIEQCFIFPSTSTQSHSG